MSPVTSGQVVNTPLAWGHDTGTHELPKVMRGLPLAEQLTTELLIPTRPPLAAAPRRGIPAHVRAAAAIAVATLGAGICFIAQIAGAL